MFRKIKTWITSTFVDRPLPIGTTISSYEIVSNLGMGSYGIAYLVKETQTGKLFVAKQCKPSLFRTPKGLALQQYEKRILTTLSHPQIPQFIDHIVDEEQKHAFLIMTYFHGHTVEDFLFEQEGTFDERKAVQLIRKIVDLVRYIHLKSIIHRDIRIPNVILIDQEPYLIDFGLARFLGDSPNYIADFSTYGDDKRLKRMVHPSSDLYALGHFLLFLLYSTYQPTDHEQEEKSWEEELTLTKEIRLIIRKLLQVDKPYSHIDEFMISLDNYLHK